MNRSIFDYNGVSNDLPYQKLEPNFSYDIIDLESNLEKTDPTSFAKKSLLNRIIKDIDSDIFKQNMIAFTESITIITLMQPAKIIFLMLVKNSRKI